MSGSVNSRTSAEDTEVYSARSLLGDDRDGRGEAGAKFNCLFALGYKCESPRADGWGKALVKQFAVQCLRDGYMKGRAAISE